MCYFMLILLLNKSIISSFMDNKLGKTFILKN
jgi:hypothetical protein